MKKIPVLSMANFGQYVQMLHYMLFQEEIQRQEFQFQTVIEDGKNIYRHLGDELDADGGWDSTNVERIHMTEETLLQMIREDNLEYRNVLDRLTGLELPVQFPAAGQFRQPEKRPDDFLRAMTRCRDSGRHAPADRIRDGNRTLRPPGARRHHDGFADGQSPHDGGLHPQGA